MFAVIKLHKVVYQAIIEHANINRELECGGYLYGYSKKTVNGIEVIITHMYYEKFFGTDRSFNYNLSYGVRAKSYQYVLQQQRRKIKLIGCYHSHGIYPAIFSDEDRMLQRVWAGNQATLIYSPYYDELVGDIIKSNGEVIQARITTFDSDIYEDDYFKNVAYEKVMQPGEDLCYETGDRPKTLKLKQKKR